MFNDQAMIWAISFLVVYVAAQVFVARHPRFASYSPIKRSLAVKVISLAGFTLAYVFVQMGNSGI